MSNSIAILLTAVICIGLLVGGILLSESTSDIPSSYSHTQAVARSSASPSHDESWRTRYADWTGDRISGSHYFGCIYRDHFEELLGYATQGDQEMFSAALAAGLSTGLCCRFQEGEPVYLEDVVWSGLVQLRRPGEPTKHWTVAEAIGIGKPP